MRLLSLTLPLVTIAAILLPPGAGAKPAADEWPLVFRDDFEKGADRWEPTDPKAWRVDELPGRGKVYHQHQQSKYTPPHRSPLNIALVKDLVVGDFVLEADVRSTSTAGAHRDMCLFFGYQDPAHFYYVHIAGAAGAADPHANQIFIVNNEPRKKISAKSTHTQPWDAAWHRVKLVRRIADGAIEVYFDGGKTPVMTATDKTFTHGRVGIGSFDDTGYWDNVTIRGMKLAK
jgi:hypothetical protein